MIQVNIDNWHDGRVVVEALQTQGIVVADASEGEPNIDGKTPPYIDADKNYWLAIDAKDKDKAEQIINAIGING